MIDTHAHIHDSQFDGDRDEVIRRAFASGVKRIITVGTSVSESVDALAVAKKYEHVFAMVAIHPHEFNRKGLGMKNKESGREMMREIEILARDEKVVAIGECGLDYHVFDGVPVTEEQKEVQKSGFREHLELAVRIEKPIVIHARESYGDVLEMLREYVTMLPAVILHCYQGDLDMTRKFLDLDERITFSFAGNITYPVKKALMGTKDDICESIKIISLDRILTETDCPYLAPQKFRGTRNEPAYVAEVARKIADVKGVSLEEVGRVTGENAKRCFFVNGK
jgi:TatD DNase family protein